MNPGKTESPSMQNHTLLVQLTDAVASLNTTVSKHISEQQQENDRLHQRIDNVQNETRKGVDEIKASLAGNGKINSGHIAVLIALLTMFGGLAHAYLSVRLGNITPLIDSNKHQLEALHAELRQHRDELTATRIESARTNEARRWLEKIIDHAR